MESDKTNEEGKSIICSAFDLCLINGISHCTYHKNLIVDAAIARQMTEARLLLSGADTLPALVDARQGAYVTGSARRFLADSHSYKQVSAMAIIINHHVMKVLFNTLLRIKICETPVRLFTDREQALAWLEGFKEKKKGRNNRYVPLLMF